MRQSDLVALLEKNAEDRTWELEGGFRFSKGNKGSGKSASSPIHDLELSTVTLSLKWLSAIIELLRSKTSTNIVAGGGSFISIARVENQIRVIRINGGQASKEQWLAFDDVVLDVREQAKLYLKVANRIEQILERRESQLADKQRKDAAQRRKAVSNKLHTAAFTSMLDTLHGLLASSTEFPDLSKKFQVLEADLAQQRRRIKEENQDMINILFAHIPSSLVDANLSHIAAKLEPPQEESSAPAAAAESASSPEASSQAKVEAPKKLSKKEQAAAEKAAKEAEAERKKQQEAEQEAARKSAEQVRREKAEKLAAIQAEQKRKQTIANPFTHLETFSESAQAKLEKEQDAAKEHSLKRAAEAKVKQEQDRLEESARIAAEKAEEAKARAAKVSASASVEKAVKAAEDAKKAAQKAAEDSRKAASRSAQKEAEEKKKANAERAAAEKAAAEKKKAEKAERAAAHQAAEKAAAEKKKAAAAVSASSSSPASAAPAEKKVGRDRSEKQRKAEQIEAKGLEKQRKGQMSAIAAQKRGADNTNLYIAGGAGAVIALVVAYMIFSHFSAAL
jgi:hypothetical protein